MTKNVVLRQLVQHSQIRVVLDKAEAYVPALVELAHGWMTFDQFILDPESESPDDAGQLPVDGRVRGRLGEALICGLP